MKAEQQALPWLFLWKIPIKNQEIMQSLLKRTAPDMRTERMMKNMVSAIRGEAGVLLHGKLLPVWLAVQ